MKTETLIGRKTEIAEIQNCIKSDRSEFVILYGRRRIGKTFLVKKFFDGKFDFHFVGASRHTTPQQLEDFGKSLAKYADTDIQTPRNWSDALDMLARHLETINKKRKKIIFIDEMPWIDRKQSDFVAALVIITLGTVHKTIPAHVWLIDGFIKQEKTDIKTITNTNVPDKLSKRQPLLQPEDGGNSSSNNTNITDNSNHIVQKKYYVKSYREFIHMNWGWGDETTKCWYLADVFDCSDAYTEYNGSLTYNELDHDSNFSNVHIATDIHPKQ